MRRSLTAVVAMAVLASAGCSSAARFRRHVMEKPAPDFELTALDGKEVRLSSFRGSPVLLTFWAFG